MECVEIQCNDMVGFTNCRQCLLAILLVCKDVVFHLFADHESYAVRIPVVEYDLYVTVEEPSDEAVHGGRTAHCVAVWLEMGHYDGFGGICEFVGKPVYLEMVECRHSYDSFSGQNYKLYCIS